MFSYLSRGRHSFLLFQRAVDVIFNGATVLQYSSRLGLWRAGTEDGRDRSLFQDPFSSPQNFPVGINKMILYIGETKVSLHFSR